VPLSQSTQSGSWPAARSSVVWEDLRRALSELSERRGRELAVVDAGGGSGGFAVPLAELGHRVIVVDPSPDSLASLERRATEAGVGDRVSGRQGDLDTLAEAVGAEQADLLLCHDVLEIADDPRLGLAAVAAVLRPGGLLSLLAANRSAAVLGRVLAGRLDAAEVVLDGGKTGTTDRSIRRFDLGELVAFVEAAGMSVLEVHGDRVFSDLVPGAVLDTEPHGREVLARLEEKVSRLPAYHAMATRLHLLARAGQGPEADR
jgi:SAM-dependent methyltransferase